MIKSTHNDPQKETIIGWGLLACPLVITLFVALNDLFGSQCLKTCHVNSTITFSILFSLAVFVALFHVILLTMWWQKLRHKALYVTLTLFNCFICICGALTMLQNLFFLFAFVLGILWIPVYCFLWLHTLVFVLLDVKKTGSMADFLRVAIILLCVATCYGIIKLLW